MIGHAGNERGMTRAGIRTIGMEVRPGTSTDFRRSNEGIRTLDDHAGNAVNQGQISGKIRVIRTIRIPRTR